MLTVTGSGGKDRRIELDWNAFGPEGVISVTGVMDGRGYTARISAT